jgi:Integrase core domain/HTH-like domain
LIEAEKASYPIKRTCELLEVSRSGYYKWRKSRDSGPTAAQRRRAELDAKVAKFHAASDGVYGAPRILADLRTDGERVSRKTVATSLRRQGLAGICPRRFVPATTVVDLDAVVPKDLVGRCFDTGVLNRVWTSDITYLGTAEGWLYLCAVRDGCSRRVIGWAVEEHMHTDLVQAALTMAVAMRGEIAQQVILHADRGCQGGFKWSSQHLVIVEVSGGSSTASSGPGNPPEAQIARAPEISASCRGGVLAADCQRASRRRSRGHCRRGAGGRGALVPQRWRHVTVRPEVPALGPLPVLR